MEAISILKGQHTAGISSVDFSGDGKFLVSVGLDDFHLIVLWDWQRGEKLATTRGAKDKIFDAKFNPLDRTKILTCGVRFIKFWQHTGGGFTGERGQFGNVAKMETLLCIAFGKKANVAFTGAANGFVYVWNETKLVRVVEATKGPCFAIVTLDKVTSCKEIFSQLKLNPFFELSKNFIS